MRAFLRRLKQSTEFKFNVIIEVTYRDKRVGTLPVGVLAWNPSLAKAKSVRNAKQFLTIKALKSNKLKGSNTVHKVLFEVLFKGDLVGQLEILRRAPSGFIARRLALKDARANVQLKATDAFKYKG